MLVKLVALSFLACAIVTGAVVTISPAALAQCNPADRACR